MSSAAFIGVERSHGRISSASSRSTRPWLRSTPMKAALLARANRECR